MLNLMARVEEIRANASGSTYLEISKKVFRSMEILTPCESLLNMFSGITDALMKSVEKNTRTIHRLTEARDRLLPKLMSGEIEV